MRNYIILGITFIICIYLIFFDPFSKYLGIYENNMIIEHLISENGYHWEMKSNNILIVNKIGDAKWLFKANKNGEDDIFFYFVNDDTDEIKYTINYKFNIKFKNIFWTSGEASGLNDFSDPY